MSKVLGGAGKLLGRIADPLNLLGAFGNLFGGGDTAGQVQRVTTAINPVASAPTPPIIETPPPMPVPLPDDTAIQAARRRSIATQMRRRGRRSTILTGFDEGETLGG